MRVYVLGAILAGVCVWGYLQTKKLHDSDIEAFYQADAQLTVNHDADAQCAVLADDFHGSTATTLNGHSESQSSISKNLYCEQTHKFFDIMERFKKIAGHDVPVSYRNNVGEAVYSADHRSATVQVDYEYSLMDGKFMHVTGTRQETLVKRKGKVLLLSSDDRGSGTFGPQ